MDTTTLFLPGRPLLTNAERKMVPRQRAAAVKRWRTAAWAEARNRRIGLYEQVIVEATPHLRNRVGQDVAACHPTVKAAIDGLVDAGVLRNDTPTVVRTVVFHAPVLSSPMGDGLEVVIHPVDAGWRAA